MSDLKRYQGVFPAFYACYDERGNVSPERAARLTEHLISKGVQGLYVCGSSGECIYQDVEERKETLRAVVEAAAGRVTIIAHVAANSTRDSILLAKHAQSLGVDAIAAIPPIYFKLPEYSIADYWNAISAAAPETDFFIYNIPQLAGVALTPGLLKVMLQNPRVKGVKNSSMPSLDIQTFKMIGGDELCVFNGPDEQFLAGRLMGACGGIGGTYAAMPELFLRMDALIRAGRAQDATAIQMDVNRIITALCSCRGNMYAVIKELLRRRGVDIGSVRAPLSPLCAQDMPQVDRCEEMIDKAIALHTAQAL